MLFHRLRQKRRGGGLVVAAWVSHVTWIMPKCCFHFWVLFCLLQDCHSFQMKKDTFSWYSGVLNFQTNLKDVISKNPVPSQTNYWACCLTFRCSFNLLNQICSKIREIAISCLYWPLNNLVAHRTGNMVPEDYEIFFSIWSQGRQRGCETCKNCWQSASSISDSPHSGETKNILGNLKFHETHSGETNYTLGSVKVQETHSGETKYIFRV